MDKFIFYNDRRFPFAKLVYIVLILFLFSCDKNKDLVRYNEFYHIESGDTLSAIYIPNAITNNWDLQNDYFKILGFGLIDSLYELNIYNKNGQIIFSSNDISYSWDGSFKGLINENDVYTYTLKAIDSSNFEYHIEGLVHLNR